MQLTKTPERLALHPRWKDFVRWPAPVGQGMRWLVGLSLALGLLLEAAQAQVTAPDFRWASRFGSPSSAESMIAMTVDAGGNTFIVGNAARGQTMVFDGPTNLNVLSVVAADGYMAKYDPAGNPVWSVPLAGNVTPRHVVLDSVGNIYSSGLFRGVLSIGALSVQALAGSDDCFVVKFDPSGTALWLQRFGGPLDDYATVINGPNLSVTSLGGLAVSPAGSLFFAFGFDGSVILDTGGGNTSVITTTGLQDVALIKLDLQGNYLGSTQFGGTNSDSPRDLVVDAAGDVVLLGLSDGAVTLGTTTVTNAGNADSFIAKFTSSLQPIFLRQFGGQGTDSGFGITTDPARNILVTGLFNSDMTIGPVTLTNQGGFDGFLAKISPLGQLQWVQQIGGAGDQMGHKVATDAGGFIYLNGRYDSTNVTVGGITLQNGTGVSALYVVKLDPFGNAFWGQGATATRGFIGSAAAANSVLGNNSGVAYDQLGRFYISGRFEGVATFGNFTFDGGGGDMFVASLFSDFDILQHPRDLKVKRADTATFTVVTSTNLPLTFQWLYNGLPIFGATSTNYSITNAQPVNSGIYSVVVSSFTGVLISSNATLTVKLPPVITQNPLSRTVTAGSTVTLSANGTGDAPLSFRWFFNGAAIEAFSPTLTLTNVQFANQGLYSLQVSNDVGGVFSAEAGLFINSPPVVTAHPTNQSVTLASNVTFTVASAGLPPFTYQWRRNGEPISGATSQSYTITGAQFTHAGVYDVLVGNALSSVFSSNAVLTVLPPFAITPQPVGMATNVGGSATFTVGAVGSGVFAGPFTYQWTFNGVPLVGQTGPSLALTGLGLPNSGSYACVVDSPLGSQTSSNAQLTVFTPFTVGATTFQPGGLFQMNASGDDGRAYRLEMTTNFVQWLPVVTNTVSGGTATFTDSTAAGNVLRFYRIVLLP